jgi:Fe-S-cluster containining protein
MNNLLEKEASIKFRKPVINFACMKCGYCCEHLTKDTPFGKLSLFLIPEEAEWFPKDLVVPQYGVGIRGKSRPRPDVVISFQLDAMVCPWFDHQARDCTIRYKRPLVCRAYPIVQKSLDIACRFVTQYASVENEKIELNPQTIKEEIAADDTILAYIKKSMTGQAALWCW